MGKPQRELELLEKAVRLQSGEVAVFRRLHEIYVKQENWSKAALAARRMLAVNPLVAEPHLFLAAASEANGDTGGAVQSLKTLLEMDPLDPAGIHFRLAKSLRATGDLQSAKRQLLQCLEEAPRFLEAHQLLLKLMQEIESENATDAANGPNDLAGADASSDRSAQQNNDKD